MRVVSVGMDLVSVMETRLKLVLPEVGPMLLLQLLAVGATTTPLVAINGPRPKPLEPGKFHHMFCRSLAWPAWEYCIVLKGYCRWCVSKGRSNIET
jgi:hypothetical protein